MMALLMTKGLEKKYAGAHALRGVDMTIEPGKIIGLLGPNGSGKTTMMKLLACLLQPTAGEIIYPDNAKRGLESKKTVSFLPDILAFPEYMRVKDAFAFYRDMYPDYSSERANEMMKLLDLGAVMNTRVEKLSRGMKERVALGVTFSRETRLYLLDEPLGGIDPLGKSKIISAVLAMQLQNSSIMISTHLVKDTERIFDSVYFISGGRLVFEGDCDKMREENGKTVEAAYLEVFAYEGAV
ncbi:MAG: ABC transporter ATP-binding protein [Oscillospiraceae bacterium]|nr:ABC transporter ATP-binding protein [Oscillospiraceae bacterium]